MSAVVTAVLTVVASVAAISSLYQGFLWSAGLCGAAAVILAYATVMDDG